MTMDATDAEEYLEHYSQIYEEIRNSLKIKCISKQYSYWLLRRAIKKTSNLEGFHASGKLISLVENFMHKIQKIYNSSYGPDENASEKEKITFLQLAEHFLVKIYTGCLK